MMWLNHMRFVLRRYIRNEKGATAVEYGLMVALIACAIIVTVIALGETLDGLFDVVEQWLAAKTPAAPAP